jgi:hypothetical protein
MGNAVPRAGLFAIRSDSDHYPFGYWNSFSSGMNFGRKCDKKGRGVCSACVQDSWYFPDR